MIEMTKDFLLDPQTWQNISAIALPAAGAAPDIPTNKKCTANFVGMIEGRYKQVSLDITRNDNYTLSADDSRIALNAIIIAEVAKVILPQPTLECLEDPDSILIDDFWYTTVANDVQSERMWRNTKARNFEQRYFDKKTRKGVNLFTSVKPENGPLLFGFGAYRSPVSGKLILTARRFKSYHLPA